MYFIDIDGFKQVNDQLGHDVGDLLLQHIADRLTTTLRASDTVFRLGGDEFVLVAPDVAPDDVTALARKMGEAISTPCALCGHVVEVRASVGMSVYPRDGDDPKALVRQADTEMYRAKRSASQAH